MGNETSMHLVETMLVYKMMEPAGFSLYGVNKHNCSEICLFIFFRGWLVGIAVLHQPNSNVASVLGDSCTFMQNIAAQNRMIDLYDENSLSPELKKLVKHQLEVEIQAKLTNRLYLYISLSLNNRFFLQAKNGSNSLKHSSARLDYGQSIFS